MPATFTSASLCVEVFKSNFGVSAGVIATNVITTIIDAEFCSLSVHLYLKCFSKG